MCACDPSVKGAFCKKCAEKHPGGRGTVITDSVITKLEMAFAIGANTVKACEFAGLSNTKVYYERLNKDEEFRNKMEKAKTSLILKAMNSTKELLEDKHPQVTMEFMKKYFNKLWVDKVELSNDPENPVEPITIYIPGNGRD